MSLPDPAEGNSLLVPLIPEKSQNSNIKERLNLHVKRRIQETETAANGNNNSNSSLIISPGGNSSVGIATNKSNLSSITDSRRTGGGGSNTIESLVSPGNNSTAKNCGQTPTMNSSTKRSVDKVGGAKSGPNKKTKTKHSSSVSSAPDDESSRDGNAGGGGGQSSASEGGHHHNGREKDNGPDLLTYVLNQRKLSLMQDPEVMKFLGNIIKILGK